MYFLPVSAGPEGLEPTGTEEGSGNRGGNRGANRGVLHPAALIGAFLIMLTATVGLMLTRGSITGGPAAVPLAALALLAVALGVLLLRRRMARVAVIAGLVMLSILPLAAIVSSSGNPDARGLLVWLVVPTLIAAGTHDELLHAAALWSAGAVAFAVVVIADQGPYGTAIDLCVVLGALIVLDVLVRQLALSMAGRLHELRRLSTSDGLTGALNRRGLIAAMPGLVARAERLETSVGVLLVDIDRFKQINDRYGHPQGDLVLQRVCRAIAGCLDRDDLLARTGGEEMVVVVAGPAEPVAEAIRRAVADSGVDPVATVSIGFVEAGTADCRPAQHLWDLVGAADRGLYAAKRAGRDRIRRGEVTQRPAAPRPAPPSSNPIALQPLHPGRRHNTLFGCALVVFNLAGLLALATGRISPPRPLALALLIGMLAGLLTGVLLLKVRPAIANAALATAILALDVLIGIVIVTAGNPNSRQIGLLTVVIPAVVAALYLGRRFNLAHQLLVFLLCATAAYRTGSDLLSWFLQTMLAAVALLCAAEFIFQLRRRHDRAVAELHRWSTRDPLTGLINRRGLDLAFGRLDRRRPIAVIVLDVDDFKQVNDRFGHAAGDRALAGLAAGLAALTDNDTLAARIGGDEFVVVSTTAHRPPLGSRLQEALCDLPLTLSVSSGRIDIPAGSVSGLWELVALADRRLTASKAARRALRVRPGHPFSPAGTRLRARPVPPGTTVSGIPETVREAG